MADAVDMVIAYKFIRALSTPWKKWDAYELGLIDDKGNKKRKPKTGEEKKALPGWMNLIRNIKRFIEKLPFGKTRLGSFAAALWLVKEETGISDIKLLEDELERYLEVRDFIIECDILDESVEFINTLGPGKYAYEDEILIATEAKDPIAWVFGQPLFELKHIVTNKRRVVTWTNIKKL